MKIFLRKFIEESLMDSLKENWGKLALGGAALAGANAGAFGDEFQNLTHAGIDNIKSGIRDTVDYYKQDNTNNTTTPTAHPAQTHTPHTQSTPQVKNGFGNDVVDNLQKAKNDLNVAHEKSIDNISNAEANERRIRDVKAQEDGIFSNMTNSVRNVISDNPLTFGGLGAAGLGYAYMKKGKK